ncbi:MAG: GNAT family N-acetyltransferase [Lachnospiraceae bacterium]
MQRTYKEVTIRNATPEDVGQLCEWWNDGAVMAHAGFPNGLHTTEEEVRRQIEQDDDLIVRRHIIECRQKPIGEMVYRKMADGVCEIGIKICEAKEQNKGLGKIILSLFIEGLFHEFGYEKIVLDTNLNNKRAQHVYEQLGFQRTRINVDSWKDQTGEWQSSVDYELTEDRFVSWILGDKRF